MSWLSRSKLVSGECRDTLQGTRHCVLPHSSSIATAQAQPYRPNATRKLVGVHGNRNPVLMSDLFSSIHYHQFIPQPLWAPSRSATTPWARIDASPPGTRHGVGFAGRASENGAA